MNTECETIRDIVTAYGDGVEEECVKLIDEIIESGGTNLAESAKHIYRIRCESNKMINEVLDEVGKMKDRIRIIEAIL